LKENAAWPIFGFIVKESRTTSKNNMPKLALLLSLLLLFAEKPCVGVGMGLFWLAVGHDLLILSDTHFWFRNNTIRQETSVLLDTSKARTQAGEGASAQH
jgi:hypothetical protein